MTKLMGILNVTPDSFFDRGKSFLTDVAVKHGKDLYEKGADYIDIGGESTRPGSLPVEEEEELRRVIPVIQSLHKQLDIPISIDTCKARVAAEALEAGASLINDILGFRDPAMQEVAASGNVDLCLMHMQGTPANMQINPHYPDGVVPHLLKWFENQVLSLVKRGVKEKHIILDPGIGFGKSVADNLEIIQNLRQFKTLGFRVLLGVSRKSFIGKILNKPTAELLPGTLAVNCFAVISKVDIIRVHDVREHRDMLEIYSQLAI